MSGKRSQTGGIGWVLAASVFGVLVIVLGNLRYDVNGVEASFLEHFLGLPPNEMGDALAGIFGSLAFLVAAGAIYLQSRELAAQREELRLTREVMEQQRIAATDMAASMKVQATIFEKEQLEREQQSTDKEVEALVGELAAYLLSPELQSLVWKLDLEANSGPKKIVNFKSKNKTLHVSPHEGPDLYSKVGAQLHELTSRISEIENSLKQRGFAQKPVKREIVPIILLKMDEIKKRSSESSAAMNSKLKVARLSGFSLSFERIRAFEGNNALWADPQ